MHVHWLDYDVYNSLEIKYEVFLELEVANLEGIDFLNYTLMIVIIVKIIIV